LPIKFPQTFENAFQVLLSVEFNFGLNSWSLKSCEFVEGGKFLLSSWPHLFWEMFAFNTQTLHFTYPSLSQTFLTNGARYTMEEDRCFTPPLKQEVPHSNDLVLFLNGVTTFLILYWQSVARPSRSR
jgi:hypothetical protein